MILLFIKPYPKLDKQNTKAQYESKTPYHLMVVIILYFACLSIWTRLLLSSIYLTGWAGTDASTVLIPR